MLRFLVRTTVLFVLLLTLSSNTYSQDYDVKKAYWGMSPLEVQLSEGKPPDYEGFQSRYFQHHYFVRSGPNQWYPSIAQWRYLFKNNKLVKVIYFSNWKEDRFEKYNRVKKAWTKKAGQPVITRDNINGDPMQVDEWMFKNRTYLQIRLEKNPSKAGTYYYQALFIEAEYRKEQNNKKK